MSGPPSGPFKARKLIKLMDLILSEKKKFTRPLDAHKREAEIFTEYSVALPKKKMCKKNNFTKLIITLIFRQPYTTWKGSMALVYHSPFLFNQIFGSGGMAQAIFPFTTVSFGNFKAEVQSQFASLEIEPGFFVAQSFTLGEAEQIHHKKRGSKVSICIYIYIPSK